ncbi:fatty acid desaturase [Rhodococcus sp. HNM0563]|uniref:fatty acid desaturase family protein n=1 Tax=unclassified Rhodococcus (in: high G+C Gram-positive bacteria) TaxID=192944 RepID=UPI00146CEA3A|nr:MULTISPECIES: fatty acid desaturase [unclassified Rhodococcus (in: high G+C Gram-positive bacteria)]MCK0091093.1 fatty acid desaturase [Rhodococcus sp. F64268]NLU60866.1 fatty acid desaturase [Rhodococcus sp. HNM0563]
MAISDIREFAHLTDADVEALGREFDAIRTDIERSRGVRDARYIHNTIRLQRTLEVVGRLALFRSRERAWWLLGTASLSLSKIIENMELGHNVMHGQWDWMNDPEIHSTSWEWDQTGPSEHWKRAHNYAHHTYTNIVGMDDDVGFGILRMTRDDKWRPINLLQPVANVILAATFEWGIALHDLSAAKEISGVPRMQWNSGPNKEFAVKAGKQVLKDGVLFPAVTGPAWRSTLKANLTANLVRNLWAYAVIFCGHFPDGAEKFTPGEFERETRGQWYLRQLLGSANISGGKIMGFMTGNLSYQIEHHLFPDLPSNRLPEIAARVRALCGKYDLPYTTGSLGRQYWLALRTIHKLALPDRFLKATSDDAPETSSERKFRHARANVGLPAIATDPITGRRRGLLTALRAHAEGAVAERRMKAAVRHGKTHAHGGE